MANDDEALTWVVLEYLTPTSPSNRRVFEPVEGLGHVQFDDTKAGAFAYFTSLGGAPGPFRVVPIGYAKDAGLL